MKSSIYPCLWFDGQAKDAADHYCSIFKDSKITSENSMVVTFEIKGFKIMALNGGPQYKFTPASSYVIECDTQDEIDHYWNSLGEGGRFDKCGWLSDKFGVSWQIVPTVLGKLMSDPTKAPKVLKAFLKMTKFIIADLERA